MYLSSFLITLKMAWIFDARDFSNRRIDAFLLANGGIQRWPEASWASYAFRAAVCSFMNHIGWRAFSEEIPSPPGSPAPPAPDTPERADSDAAVSDRDTDEWRLLFTHEQIDWSD